MSNFFVMINSQNRKFIMPIVDDNDDVVLYETEQAAREAMMGHVYAQAFGFEIFERGTGQ